MFPSERKEKILLYTKERKKISISDLSKIFKTSDSTIRRCVKELEKEGEIKQDKGNVIFVPKKISLDSFSEYELHPLLIERIAQHAVEHIERDEEFIWLGDGAISLEMAKLIKNITIATNSLKIAIAASKQPQVHIILLGENLNNENLSLFGCCLDSMLPNLRFDRVFIEADGLNEKEVLVSKQKAEIYSKFSNTMKDQTYFSLLLKSSLIGTNATVCIDIIENFDQIIVDNHISESSKATIKKSSVNLIITHSEKGNLALSNKKASKRF